MSTGKYFVEYTKRISKKETVVIVVNWEIKKHGSEPCFFELGTIAARVS